MNEMDEIVGEFLVESYENLDQLDQDLVTLEQDPNSRPILSSIFRTIHTIKGTCGFLGFSKLEAVTHQGESLLSRLRDGVLDLTPERTTALLKMVDAVREILSNIETHGAEGDGNYDTLVAHLASLLNNDESSAANVEIEESTPANDETRDQSEIITTTIEPSKQPTNSTFQSSDIPARPAAEIAAEATSRVGAEVAGTVAPAHAELNATPSEASSATTGNSLADNSIRVDVSLLDRLMNLVGELVLARNQILQFNSHITDSTLVAATQRLNLITTELQEGVMKTRMQPIGNVWSKFPRVVRDLSLQLGKNVRLEMEGQDTELDKTILEAIKDPLTHIVRNTVDHGIEIPSKRVELGKPKEGVLLLRAFHEGGQVVIEISDDGSGLSIDRIKSKALERDLITPEQHARMNDREAAALIFLPGFSTADKITNVSGRGVGMDVVKTNIEKIGGSVDVTTEVGFGTTFKIKIPLTLAIIPALTVTASDRRYAIPQVSLLELVRIEGEVARTGIELIHGAPVYRLRGQLLPLVELSAELGLKDPNAPKLGCDPDIKEVNIVVLQTDERQFGMVVDGVNDTEEIVVKPLSEQLKHINVFSGTTIMGDGTVALILDVVGLAQNAAVISEISDHRGAETLELEADQVVAVREDQRAVLLFAVGEHGRMAVALDDVDRLEEFTIAEVEYGGGRQVVQYRGDIMQLIPLTEAVGGMPLMIESPSLHVVVITHGEKSIGLIVDQVLDIVEDAVVIRQAGSRFGVLGSAIIQGKVTDLMDSTAVVSSFDPMFYSDEYSTQGAF